MLARTVVLVALFALAQSDRTVRPTALPSDLDIARRTLEQLGAGGTRAPLEVLGMSLAGYNFHRELDVGQGLRVIAVSCTLAVDRGLLAFDRNGKLIGKSGTGEIISIQLVDLDHDAIDEIITEEVVNCSTGNFTTVFAVYRISETSIKRIWMKEAFYDDNVPPAPEERKLFFVRPVVTEEGCVTWPGLLYVAFDPIARSWSKERWRLRDDTFRRISEKPQIDRR